MTRFATSANGMCKSSENEFHKPWGDNTETVYFSSPAVNKTVLLLSLSRSNSSHETSSATILPRITHMVNPFALITLITTI